MTHNSNNFLGSGLTIEQVAKRARVTPSYLRQIARKGTPSAYTQSRLIAILNCPIEVLLWGYKAYLEYKKAESLGATGCPVPDTGASAATAFQHRVRHIRQQAEKKRRLEIV